MNDMVKINFAKIFEVAFQEMMAEEPMTAVCGGSGRASSST